MTSTCDVLIGGTGLYAQKIAFAMGMTSPRPLTVAIAGRNRERMAWLARSTNARAFLFERQVRAFPHPIAWDSAEGIAESLSVLRPRVVVQAASVQSPRALDASATPCARMIREAGGFGVTVFLQALLAARMARAQAMSGIGGALINACYPDTANRVLALLGLTIHCGSGNISSIAALLSAELGFRRAGRLHLLYQHQSPTDWRKPAAERRGVPPRVWVDNVEMDDVYDRFADVIMPVDPGQSIAGTTTVPMIYAFLGWGDYQGHAPGPNGLPGGYPITIRDGRVALDLPASLSEDDAIAWYGGFRDHEPLWIEDDGRVAYSERARRAFDAHGAGHLGDAHVNDLEAVAAAWLEAKERLDR